MKTDLSAVVAFVLIAAACSHSAEPAQEGTAIEQVEAIAKRVARGVEELKGKYPHLKEFSTTKHVRKHVVQAGFLPGTPINPELFSISYHNGILGQKPVPEDGRKRSAEEIYDSATGVRLYIHFFRGQSRGCDARRPQMIDNLSVHLYVKGPAADTMRADIQKILDELRKEYE